MAAAVAECGSWKQILLFEKKRIQSCVTPAAKVNKIDLFTLQSTKFRHCRILIDQT